MEVNEIMPYFVEKANNKEEFIRLQNKLFGIGYKWLSTNDEVWEDINFLSYPIYVSNLSFLDIDVIKKFERLRNNLNEHSNNILFLDKDMNSFDLRLLRKLKLERINSVK